MQVEVLGVNQSVVNGLLGQVTALEIVGNHKHQGFFPSAIKLNVARLSARAFASGGSAAAVEDPLLKKHYRVKQTVRANIINKALQFVLVCRRHQEADGVSGWALGRIVDWRQVHYRLTGHGARAVCVEHAQGPAIREAEARLPSLQSCLRDRARDEKGHRGMRNSPGRPRRETLLGSSRQPVFRLPRVYELLLP